jgi:hypothetical protein
VVVAADRIHEVVRALRACSTAEARNIPVPGECELLAVVEGSEVYEIGKLGVNSINLCQHSCKPP